MGRKTMDAVCRQRRQKNNIYANVPCQHDTPPWLYNRRCYYDTTQVSGGNKETNVNIAEQVLTFMLIAIIVSFMVALVYGVNVNIDGHDQTKTCWGNHLTSFERRPTEFT